jgi:hypothetical protein
MIACRNFEGRKSSPEAPQPAAPGFVDERICEFIAIKALTYQGKREEKTGEEIG